MEVTARPRLWLIACRLLALRRLERVSRRAARHLAWAMLSGQDSDRIDLATTALINACERDIRQQQRVTA